MLIRSKYYIKMKTTLDKIQIGSTGIILKVEGESKLKRRLYDMGITPGASVLLKKKAPLGDPIEVNIRGYELSLRKNEASCIIIDIEGAE